MAFDQFYISKLLEGGIVPYWGIHWMLVSIASLAQGMFLIEYAPLNCVREITKWKNKQKVHAGCGDTKGT